MPKKTNAELSELVADLEGNVSHLQAELGMVRDDREVQRQDRNRIARYFDSEKQEHRETHQVLRERVNEIHNLNLELREATKQIAFLLTQNVRLQGRVEGLLIASGKLQLVDAK